MSSEKRKKEAIVKAFRPMNTRAVLRFRNDKKNSMHRNVNNILIKKKLQFNLHDYCGRINFLV